MMAFHGGEGRPIEEHQADQLGDKLDALPSEALHATSVSQMKVYGYYSRPEEVYHAFVERLEFPDGSRAPLVRVDIPCTSEFWDDSLIPVVEYLNDRAVREAKRFVESQQCDNSSS
jgi:hypothetical protein